MFKYIYKFLDKLKEKFSQKGQGMVEYALIIAFIAAIAGVALKTDLGSAIKTAFSDAATSISTAKETGGTTTPAPAEGDGQN